MINVPRHTLIIALAVLSLIGIAQNVWYWNQLPERVRASNSPSYFWLLNPKLEQIDERLGQVLAGDDPRGVDELLALAQRSYQLRRFAQAMHFFEIALSRSEFRMPGSAYNAACCAALSERWKAIGEPKPDAEERANLRSKALGWLTIALSDLEKSWADTPPPSDEIEFTLRHWQSDADLASVRDEDLLSKLSESERTEWQTLWKRVDELLKKAEASNSATPLPLPRKL